MDGEAMMNTGEKIDYMIQCLKVAKAEYEYTADYIANEPTEGQELWEFLDTHRSPNKALIRNVDTNPKCPGDVVIVCNGSSQPCPIPVL